MHTGQRSAPWCTRIVLASTLWDTVAVRRLKNPVGPGLVTVKHIPHTAIHGVPSLAGGAFDIWSLLWYNTWRRLYRPTALPCWSNGTRMSGSAEVVWGRGVHFHKQSANQGAMWTSLGTAGRAGPVY